MALFLFVVLATSLLTIQINGFPSGAPKKACSSMIPRHKHNSPQPSSTSPITKFETTWNPDGETMTVKIESSKSLKGAFIQGRKMNGTDALGTFINIPSETHLVSCSTGDAITHNSPQKWTKVEFTWKKPTSIKSGDQVQFWATIVVDFKTFWLVKSVE